MLIITTTEFSVRSLNKTDKFYGFSLKEDPFHLMPDGTIFHNSGKSVTEQAM